MEESALPNHVAGHLYGASQSVSLSQANSGVIWSLESCSSRILEPICSRTARSALIKRPESMKRSDSWPCQGPYQSRPERTSEPSRICLFPVLGTDPMNGSNRIPELPEWASGAHGTRAVRVQTRGDQFGRYREAAASSKSSAS